MGNANWLCFDCRRVVRRPTHYREPVPCPDCRRPCRNFGTRLRVPAHDDLPAWRRLREWAQQVHLDSQARAQRTTVRTRHNLEHRIATLEKRPDNPGRAAILSRLRKRLDEIG